MERRISHKEKRASLEANIATLCRRFRFHEVEECVLPIFRKVTWRQVLYLLKRHRKTLSLVNIAQALIASAKDEPFAFLEDMYFELYLTHKIVHSKSYTWNAFKMIGGQGKAGLVTEMQISEALKNSFRSLAHAPRIKVKLFGSLSWIMIIQKKQKHSGTEFEQQPFICAYIPGEPYFFASQKNVKTNISDGLLSTFGYRRLNDCKLSAPDIASMVTLLRNKAAKAFDAHSAQHSIVPYSPGPSVATEDGMDFTDEQWKINYANIVFGKDCPVMKKFTVKEVGPIVKNRQMYRTTFTIRSNDVFQFLKVLLVKGILTMPLSPYIERIITLGKNTIIIMPQNIITSQVEDQR
ncbi:uncharacterized protein LOC126248350 isoform X1 [Schistocerca nitens]|uniref:uncharacterized protein LOC126248350 isoform X1 n=1 Tax=Schistocerca nitens TaxID=7011 RepID=UPI0021172D2E|nr:uncharacterized protein LOC126248350 isoform X1 [Schistocerca nitens]